MGGVVAFLIVFLLFTIVSLQLVNIYYPPTIKVDAPLSAPVIMPVNEPGPPSSEDPRKYQGDAIPLDSRYGWWGAEDNWMSSLNQNINTIESALLGSNSGNVLSMESLLVRSASNTSNASGFLDLTLHPYQS